MVDRVTESPFMAVFGPSGSGKSSVIRAGLIPALLESGEQWRCVLLTPGEHPRRELAERVGGTGVPPGQRLLVVADQFEEVFTLCPDEQERVAFFGDLVALALEPRVRVVIGVRADFYARCAGYPELVTAIDRHQLLVSPMSDDNLREAVTGPARWAGLSVEQALAETVVAEARRQPGALPMVSHALAQTWSRRSGTTLTLAAYRAAGGMAGAVARTAERVYADCGPAERAAVRRILLRMTAFGDGAESDGTDYLRRRVSPGELQAEGDDEAAVASALRRLTESRLVTADRDTVTVGHEALFQQWPRLREWLAEDRELLREHRRLTEAAAEWTRQGQNDAYLYRGVQLTAWEERPREGLNSTERAFLDVSRRREARARRRSRHVLVALTAALGVTSLAAVAALVQADQRAAERDVAVSRQLSAQARSRLELEPDAAVRLALRAYDTAPTGEAESVLRQAVVEQRPMLSWAEQRGRLMGVAVSPDGRSVATAGDDGDVFVRRWPLDEEGGALVLHGDPVEVSDPQFSQDGGRVAVAGSEDGVIRVWQLSQPMAPVRLEAGGGDPIVLGVSFHPEGKLLASAHADGTIRVWDLATGRPLRTMRAHGDAVDVSYSPDGRLLATSGADATVRIWDAATGRQVRVLTGPLDETKSLAWSPDGARVAAASIDGSARIWAVDGEDAEPVVLRGHRGTVEGIAFSRDGRQVATTSDDRTVRVWNSDGSGDPLVLAGHDGTVWGVTFSADGTRLFSAADDGVLRVWDPRGPGDPEILRGATGATWIAALRGDGERIMSGGSDGTVRIWDGDPRVPRIALTGHTGEIYGGGWSGDGTRVVTASRDGTVRVWGVASGRSTVVWNNPQEYPWQAVFSPDGTRVAIAGSQGSLVVVNADGTGRPLVRAADPGMLRDVAYAPDGSTIATAGADGTVRVWDADGIGEPLVLSGHEGLVWAVTYLPDGRHLASAGRDATVRVWDLADPGAAPLVHRGHLGFVWAIAASPDERWLASNGKDGTVRVWPAGSSGEPAVYSGFGSPLSTVAFTPDSRGLVTAHEDGPVRTWSCLACEPVDEVRRTASAITH